VAGKNLCGGIADMRMFGRWRAAFGILCIVTGFHPIPLGVWGAGGKKKERKERKKGEIVGNQAHFLYHILILLLVAV